MDSNNLITQTFELNLPNQGQFNQNHLRPRPKTASVYFAELFPEAAKRYGCPFVEIRDVLADGRSLVTPVSINLDFFASALGGDVRLGESTVYFEPEMQWYYKEPVLQLYKPTSPEKLTNLYRAWMMRAAQELPAENNRLNLCIEFRSDKTAKAVIQRAKSILAASHDFFSATSKHQRIRGIEMTERVARKFVDEVLNAEPGQILKLADAYNYFRILLKEKDLPDIKRSDFKAVVGPLITEQFHVCLRNDLDGAAVRGWKGIRLLV